jgi:glutamate-1-semialdehyde 2,1-aminomutase
MERKRKTNAECFAAAREVLVGGVNSPVRAWKSVGGTPRFFLRGAGAMLEDVEGDVYTDYVCSWGPLILGHAHPEVVAAVVRAAADSPSFGAPSPLEIELALKVRARFPSMELIRFVNSGTEATMTALRVARGFTGRKLAVKFSGCYHGHADAFLVAAGSGALTLGCPDSPGIPEDVASCTIVLPYNDIDAVKRCFAEHAKDIAAVIVEPWAGNMGLVPPREGFLESLREITATSGSLLIFDEVITGFRVPEGGVQQRLSLVPDLTCLGKIIGGGLPVGAFGGRREIMEKLAPVGPVYQAGTLAGNPLAMAAGIATLSVLERPETYRVLEARASRFAAGLADAAKAAHFPLVVTRLGSVLGMFFASAVPATLDEVKRTRGDLYPAFFAAMVEAGHLFAPSAFEALFVSTAHDEAILDETLAAAERIFRELAKKM